VEKSHFLEHFKLAKIDHLQKWIYHPPINFLNPTLLVAGESPYVMATSLFLAGVLFSIAGSYLSIAACTRTFKFL
jgi:hypothetical protein